MKGAGRPWRNATFGLRSIHVAIHAHHMLYYLTLAGVPGPMPPLAGCEERVWMPRAKLRPCVTEIVFGVGEIRAADRQCPSKADGDKSDP